jgi:gluconate kinase
MPPTLLDSQLATLQEPTPDENPLIIDIGPPPDTLVATILKAIG